MSHKHKSRRGTTAAPATKPQTDLHTDSPVEPQTDPRVKLQAEPQMGPRKADPAAEHREKEVPNGSYPKTTSSLQANSKESGLSWQPIFMISAIIIALLVLIGKVVGLF